MITKKILLTLGFFMFTPIFIFFTFAYYVGLGWNVTAASFVTMNPEKINGDQPLVLEQSSSAMVLGAYTLADAIPVVVSRYLERYNSPIPAEPIIRYADEFGIDPRLIVAIAQQESNLGKKMPESCHNAWGFGIHSRGTLCFENWDEGVKAVTKGIAENYCQRGLCDDPCLMMKKYTPQSDGSWCFGVNQFLEEMRTGNF